MKARLLILLVALMISMCPETYGAFGNDVYRRSYSNLLMNVFEMAYAISEPFGVNQKNIYFLSRYAAQYPQAMAACKALKGQLAEITSPKEFTFVTDFTRGYLQNADEVFISGYRTTNQGSFISSSGVDMISQYNAFDENRGDARVYNNNTLYTYFHSNRPRVQNNHMPTCLSIEKRGNALAMNNGKCADPNYQRYLCETQI